MERTMEIIQILAYSYPEVKTGLLFTTAFELLIATILSAQTTDVQVNRVTPALFEAYPDPAAMAQASCAEVTRYIKGVGLHNAKARYLVATAKILMEAHCGRVPQTMDSLLTLPGVGRKTANVVLANAFNMPALAVDTHVFRVARRLGLAQGNSVEHVEEELKDIIPVSEWIAIHHRLIEHGRQVCTARKPKCISCRLTHLCPSNDKFVS